MGNSNSLGEDTFHSRYTLGKKLGKGAQGRVHVCIDKVTGAQRAVKIMDRSAKTAWATYRREVELCRAVSSRAVVKVHDDFVDTSFCYVIMDRFEGHLRKGLKFVAKEVGSYANGASDGILRRIVGQVLSGVRHMHEAHISHRDVKSHNILIDRLDLRDHKCRAVLADLGLARRLEPGRLLSAQVGTRKYWAPELYDKKYCQSVDVFAVGVLLFLAICNQYPYLDEQQTRDRDVFAEGAVPHHLSADGRAFMMLLLTKDPAHRQTPQQLAAHAWLANDCCCIIEEDEMPVAPLPAAPVFFGPKVHQLGRNSPPHRGDIADGFDIEERSSDIEAPSVEPLSHDAGDSDPLVLPCADISFCDSAGAPSPVCSRLDVQFSIASPTSLPSISATADSQARPLAREKHEEADDEREDEAEHDGDSSGHIDVASQLLESTTTGECQGHAEPEASNLLAEPIALAQWRLRMAVQDEIEAVSDANIPSSPPHAEEIEKNCAERIEFPLVNETSARDQVASLETDAHQDQGAPLETGAHQDQGALVEIDAHHEVENQACSVGGASDQDVSPDPHLDSSCSVPTSMEPSQMLSVAMPPRSSLAVAHPSVQWPGAKGTCAPTHPFEPLAPL